jgi:ketosteroid isomerase-like protein
MSQEESTTPDLVELSRGSSQAVNSGDLDAMVSVFAPDAVWDLSPVGMGTFEGRAEIRGFAEDWLGAYEEFEMKAEERHDLGNGVTFSVIRQKARPAASQAHVATRYAAVAVWVEGMIVRATQYADIDEARAAGERLAKERG